MSYEAWERREKLGMNAPPKNPYEDDSKPDEDYPLEPLESEDKEDEELPDDDDDKDDAEDDENLP